MGDFPTSNTVVYPLKWIKCVLKWYWPGAVQSPDTPVGCVFGGSCVLPCRFQPNGDTTLHWVKVNGKEVKVHRYSRDQDKDQDPLYEERTSLFHDQISGGNASLSLARVNLQDQGRYLCYTSTSQNDWMTSVTLTVRVLPRVRCYSLVTPRGSMTSPGPSTTTRPSSEDKQDKRRWWKQSGSSM
uniref:Ig-like domain-containing protein n=1 Tax=Gadus morhua TaxID=8049 RepID=A0A8C5BZ45_GADMO